MNDKRHRYDYDIDPASGSGQAQVLRYVGRGRRVLELGAGPGAITRHLTTNGCRVLGVDIDDSALAVLAGRCERALKLDLESQAWASALEGEGPFDAIVLADVLEHLQQPEILMGQLHALCSPATALVACLPHAAYAGVLAGLLCEDFAYAEQGILDRTHLRFFGLKNMQDLFIHSGFKISQAYLVRGHPLHTEFAPFWRALSRRQRRLLEAQDFADTSSVVIKALRAADMPGAGLDLLSLAPPKGLWQRLLKTLTI